MKHFKKFEIRGLHGDRNLTMEFSDRATVLVGENGSGKTTALNALYSILSGKYYKLQSLIFHRIILTTDEGRALILTPEDILSCVPDIHTHAATARLLRAGAPPKLIQELTTRIRKVGSLSVRRSHAFRKLTSYIPSLPINMLIEMIQSIARESSPAQPTQAIEETEQWRESDFNFDVLYFPTYRRVEEDLHQLGYDNQELQADEKLIHFGMSDVKDRFEHVTRELKDSASEWYARISGRMLSQLISGISITKEQYDQLENKQALGIVLERVGDGISSSEKAEILRLSNTDNIREEKYQSLVYFLSNLVQIYDQQKDADAQIKNFAVVVNRYLVDKNVVYDEKGVRIDVVDDFSKRSVDLGQLSSGEKQTVSLFSRLYLTKDTECAILFDEPELSLSMEWQKALLPDILSSGRCCFLIAATHSPFIFDNELDNTARPLTVRRTGGNQ